MNVIIRCKREERELIRWWRRSTRRDRVVIKADYVGWSRFRVHLDELSRHSVSVIWRNSCNSQPTEMLFLVDSLMIGNCSPWTYLNAAEQGDGTGWPFPPPPYNVDAEGIFIGATKSDGNVNDWKIHFSNVQCGWR